MQIRAAGFFEVTGLALVHRVVSAKVCTVSYEEHTPEPWNVALLASSMAGRPGHLAAGAGAAPPAANPLRSRLRGQQHTQPPTSQVRPATASFRTAQPPPPPAAPHVERGAELLPERAHDPRYYPGLVEDLPVEWAAGKPWTRWGIYAGGALALFIAGLFVRSMSSGPTTWNAVIDVTPAEAQVTVDGEPLPGSSNPRTRSGLIRGDHVLSVMHEGYEPHRQVFRLTEGDQRIVVTLEREKPKEEPVAEPVPPAVVDPAAGAASIDESLLSPKQLAKKRRRERIKERYRARKEAGASNDEPAERASSSGSSGGTGLLKLNSVPWAEVYVDNKKIGNTPILGLPLSAGKHTIKLQNPQLGVKKTIRIKVKAGETVVKVEKLTP